MSNDSASSPSSSSSSSSSEDERAGDASPASAHSIARKRKRSDSVGARSDEGASGEDAERKRAKKAKKKEKKREKKLKKKAKKKAKKRRKKEKKKEKKKKSKKSKKLRPQPGAVDQSQYGSRGIIRAADMFVKGPEFECWLREVKHVNDCSRRDQQEHFKDFMEDFNTATMPHEKYYDLERWQMGEAHKAHAKLMKKAQQQRRDGVGLNDEAERAREKKAERERSKRDELHAALTALNPEKIAQMKRQQLLQGKMQQAWKSGDHSTADKLMQALKPDDAKEIARLERIKRHHQ
jgi:hypothetical protein